MTWSRVDGRREIVPGKFMCSRESPTGMGGATSTPSFSPTRQDKYSAIRVSVIRGQDGPCCSTAPTGSRIRSDFLRYALTSSHVLVANIVECASAGNKELTIWP